MVHLASPVPEVTHVSVGVLVFGVVVALALGWYGARWLQAERDEESLRARLAAAVRVMWQSRRALAGVIIVAGVFLDLWFRGKGR